MEPRHTALTKRLWNSASSRLVLTVFIALATLATLSPAAAEEITLVEAVEEALSSNSRLQAAGAQIQRAEAGVDQARSAILPDFAAKGDYTRSEEPNLVTPMRELPSQQNPSPLDLDDQIYSGVLRLDVPILNLSAVSGIRASRHGVDAERARRVEAEQRIIAAVTEIFVQNGQVSDNLTLMDGHVRALERRLSELRILTEEGRVPPTAVAEVQATLQTVLSDLLELRQRREELSYRLATLLGREEPVSPVVPQFIDPPRITTSEDRLGGPATHVAEAQYLAAQSARDGARTSFVPRIDGFATQSLRSGSDFDFNAEWSLGLSVTVPILTGGERRARLTAAEADLLAAEHNRAAVTTEILADAGILQRQWANAAERGELLQSAVENQERAVRAVEDRFQEGRGSLSELLTAETTLLELRMHQQSTRYDQLLAYLTHSEITGELSAPRIQSLIQE
ncbi:MAG: TolC family protein [Alkalispirochaeta sp.]